MRGAWKLCLVAVGVMASVTCVAVPLFYRDIFEKEILAGWAVSLVCGVGGTWMRRRAMGGGPARFFGWGVLGSVLRLLITVAMVMLYSVLDAGYLPAFAVTVVVGYLSFTAVEVGALYRQAVGGVGQHE